MRAVVQRVSRARVTADGSVKGEIAIGLLILLGVGRDDTSAVAASMAEKISNLRLEDWFVSVFFQEKDDAYHPAQNGATYLRANNNNAAPQFSPSKASTDYRIKIDPITRLLRESNTRSSPFRRGRRNQHASRVRSPEDALR